MDWGMKNRLARIFNQKSGRTVMLAVDHGYFQGPTTCLKKPRETIMPLLPYCDSLFVTRGVLRNCISPSTNTPIFLRVSGGPSVLGELSNEDITTSMKEALRLNAVGKKIPEKDALQMAFNAISRGAAGVDMGRNIFQSENPVAMIQAVRAVVHENYSPEEAFEMFNKLKGQKVVDS